MLIKDMQVGDFYISRRCNGLTQNYPVICVITKPLFQMYVSAMPKHSEYLKTGCAGMTERNYNVFHEIVQQEDVSLADDLTDIRIADIIKNHCWRKGYKEKYAKWLGQQLIKKYGEPPTKVVEASPQDNLMIAVEEDDPLANSNTYNPEPKAEPQTLQDKSKVSEPEQASGFIRFV